jgi:ABC-2 type transport system ATP-binding protein
VTGTDYALETDGLTRSYGAKRVVDGLDLRVAVGDVYGFLGPNGAGKTTTMRMILGLIQPEAGAVRIFGEAHPVARRARVGGIIEGPRFYPYLSGRENLRIFAESGGGVPDGRIEDLLKRVRLGDRGDDKVRTYSLGMKQRLGIAQALLASPSLLLLDEPTNGLDPAGQKEVRDLILRLRDEEALTVFISSHLLHEIEGLCNRVGILQEGRKIAEGTTADLLQEGETLEDCFLRLTGGDPEGQIR